jgi:hypothetical protein
MAMNLKIPSSDEKIHYKIFHKQNLDSLLKISTKWIPALAGITIKANIKKKPL